MRPLVEVIGNGVGDDLGKDLAKGLGAAAMGRGLWKEHSYSSPIEPGDLQRRQPPLRWLHANPEGSFSAAMR